MKTTCPTCGAENDSTNSTCDHCGHQYQPSKKAKVNLTGVSRPKVMTKLTLCFLVDQTGSSNQFKLGIQKMCQRTLASLETRVQTVEVTVIVYGDKDEGQQPQKLCEGVTPEAAIDVVNRITFEGGGPPKENHLCGYEFAAGNVNWALKKSEGRNALVCFSTADTKPATSGETPKAVGELLTKKDVLLFSVAEPYPFLYDISETANGLVFGISNDPSDDDIALISSKLAASITSSISSGGTTPAPQSK